LQIHPDRENAEKLFKKAQAKNRKTYPDPYDKPEMVIALQDFGGFAGFQNWDSVKSTFGRYETLRECFCEMIEVIEKTTNSIEFYNEIDKQASMLKQLLEFIVKITDNKSAFINQMKNLEFTLQDSNLPDYKICLPKLAEKLKLEIEGKEAKNIRDRVTLQLLDQYGADVGILITLMLQYIELEPLESMLLSPNVPHCYFKGEIIEIMHSSNNVIRLGLTKKFKDKKNLLKLVNYKHGSLDILNRGVKHETRQDISSTDLSDFVLNYSTEFDHLFKTHIILRDGRPSFGQPGPKDFLFYLRNNYCYEGLFKDDIVAVSKYNGLPKDCILLNMGAPVMLKDTEEGEDDEGYIMVGCY
jgi:mannose-6-phosphate isomerase